jgi:hypothetical protein
MTGTMFISYCRSDSTEFAFRLASDLETAGADVWIDRSKVRGGAEWDVLIHRAIRACRCLIVILSPAVVENKNVLNEISLAMEAKKQIIPVRFRECERPLRLHRYNFIDFIDSYDVGLRGLLHDLEEGEEAFLLAVQEEAAERAAAEEARRGAEEFARREAEEARRAAEEFGRRAAEQRAAEQRALEQRRAEEARRLETARLAAEKIAQQEAARRKWHRRLFKLFLWVVAGLLVCYLWTNAFRPNNVPYSSRGHTHTHR